MVLTDEQIFVRTPTLSTLEMTPPLDTYGATIIILNFMHRNAFVIFDWKSKKETPIMQLQQMISLY